MASVRWLLTLFTLGLSSILSFAAPPADPAARTVERIVSTVGLQARFTVLASAKVPTAAAVTVSGRRYILYNPAFMAAINRATRTDWSAVGVLAHEIGHHLNGHTVSADPRNQATSYRDELEADNFSGFVLRRLGATSDEALAALSLLAPEEDSPTHPPRSARLTAVAEGWNSAGQPATELVEAAAPPAPASAPTEPVPAAVRPEKMLPRRGEAVAGQVWFDEQPGWVVYVTRSGQLIAPRAGGLQLVGQLEPTSSRRYPFRLLDRLGRRVRYVTASGVITNAAGERVGRLRLS